MEASGLVHLHAAKASHLVAARDDQMDRLGLGREAVEACQLQRRVAAQGALTRVKNSHPHQLPSVGRDVLEQHHLLAHRDPSLSPEIGVDDVRPESEAHELPTMDHAPLTAGQIIENRVLVRSRIHADTIGSGWPNCSRRDRPVDGPNARPHPPHGVVRTSFGDNRTRF